MDGVVHKTVIWMRGPKDRSEEPVMILYAVMYGSGDEGSINELFNNFILSIEP